MKHDHMTCLWVAYKQTKHATPILGRCLLLCLFDYHILWGDCFVLKCKLNFILLPMYMYYTSYREDEK